MLSAIADDLIETVRASHPAVNAVVVVGSFARGDLDQYSDIDLICFGPDIPEYQLRMMQGRLVSLMGKTVEGAEADLLDPRICGQAVPSWRTSHILFDPTGEARRIKELATEWRWDLIEERRQRWVASTVIGFAEEISKLARAASSGPVAQRAQANLILVNLTPVMAVAAKELYTSENDLWAGRSGDPHWFEALAEAWRPGRTDIASATMRLYRYALEVARPYLNQQEREVAAHILSIAARSGS